MSFECQRSKSLDSKNENIMCAINEYDRKFEFRSIENDLVLVDVRWFAEYIKVAIARRIIKNIEK